MKKVFLATCILVLCSCVTPHSENSRNTASAEKVKNDPQIGPELIESAVTLFQAREINKDSGVSSCSIKLVKIPEDQIKNDRAYAIILSTVRNRDDGRVHDLNEVIAFLNTQRNLVLMPYVYDFRIRTPSVEGNSHKVEFKQYSGYGSEYRELEFEDINNFSSIKTYTSYTGRGWHEGFLPIWDSYQVWPKSRQLECVFK